MAKECVENEDWSENWVEYGARVYGKAYVSGKVHIGGDAQVFGSSKLNGCVFVDGMAKVHEYAVINYNPNGTPVPFCHKYTHIGNRAVVDGEANIIGCADIVENSHVGGNAIISGLDVKIRGNASVLGFARVGGNATILGDSEVTGFSTIVGACVIGGNCIVTGHTLVTGNEVILSGKVDGNKHVNWYGSWIWPTKGPTSKFGITENLSTEKPKYIVGLCTTSTTICVDGDLCSQSYNFKEFDEEELVAFLKEKAHLELNVAALKELHQQNLWEN